MINPERLKNLLIELIKIDSLSRKEYDVAMRLKREMEDLGAQVSIDDAGEKVGGNVRLVGEAGSIDLAPSAQETPTA